MVYTIDELKNIIGDIAKQYGVKKLLCSALILPEKRRGIVMLICLLIKVKLKVYLCSIAL